jgi:WD40 repeat protein
MTTTTIAPQLDQDNPWPGLEPFKEEAQDFFFGRGRETQALLSQVRDTPVTVLYGRSGLGKTSLLRAALFPLLRSLHYLPIYVRFELNRDATSLTEQVEDAVFASIRADVPDAIARDGNESLWEYLHRKDFELWSDRNFPLTPVIVLDQFEELFTLGTRVPHLVDEFRDLLGDLAENRIPGSLAARIDGDAAVTERFNLRVRNYRLLISLREDFLPDLEGWSRLIPALGRSRMRLRGLSAEAALEAVRRPAPQLMTERLARCVVGIVTGEGMQMPETADPAQADLPTQGGAVDVEPALLSLFCRELNEERKRRGQPQFDDRLLEEAQRDILSNYYASCVDDLPSRVARFIETELITETGFRDSYIRQDAVPAHLTEDELAQLISARLLRLEDRYGAQRIELTHDVLTRVVREHRDRRRVEEEKVDLARRAEDERARRLQSDRVARRFRWLSVALALVCVLAVVSMVAMVKANNAAVDRFRDATVQRLYGESQLALAGLQSGGSDDVLGMQELLAAAAIPSGYRGETYPLLAALNQERDLLKVVDLPEVVSTVAFSPDQSRIASGSTDATVRIWNAADGHSIGAPLRGHRGWVLRVAYSPDGRRVASASRDGTVRIWDAATGAPVGGALNTNNGATSVAFSPDGTLLAASSLGEIRLWNVATGQPEGEPLRGHEGIVWDLAFSRDGTRIVSGGSDKTVRLWDVATRRQIGPALQGHTDEVYRVAFSPDGTQVASGSLDATVRLWDARIGRQFGQPLQHNTAVTGVAYRPDGTRIATTTGDGKITLWDPATGTGVGTLAGHRSAVEGIAFSSDGSRLVSGGDDKTVRIWDVTSWQPLIGHQDSVIGEFSDDGRSIVSGGKDQTVRWWDAATGRPLGAPVRVDDPNVEALYPLGADKLLSIDAEYTRIRLWDAHTHRPIGDGLTLPRDILGLRSIDWNEKVGKIAATVDSNTIQVIDVVGTGPLPPPITVEQQVDTTTFSPDGRILATGDSDGSVQLRDAHSGNAIGSPMTSDGYVTAVAFSKDGRLIAVANTSGKGNTLRLWDARTFRPLGDAIRLDSAVAAATFSPDRSILAAGAADGTIRFWGVADRTPLGPALTGHTGSVLSLDFNPDGTTLLSGSADHSLRRWPVPAVHPSPDTLCAKLTHNMSKQQWTHVVAPSIQYITVCRNLPNSENSE